MTTSAALSHVRICDLSGQLAGAGATRTLAAFGAQVIRIEDPIAQGKWDILRGGAPYVDERRGNELGGGFNNHNVEKLGITLNTRTERGRELLAEIIKISDVVTENFSAEVVEKWGFSFERMQELRPDIIYVSNCGFGHTGPYMPYRTWGPIVQAVSGLTFTSGAAGLPSAGYGYSYMDHHGGNFMALAILSALYRRSQTGEGQYVDMSCVEAGAAMIGPDILDWSVNGRSMRAEGSVDSTHSRHPRMAPHNIYPSLGDDQWVSVACRSDDDWHRLVDVVDEPWVRENRWATTDSRLEHQIELDRMMAAWTVTRDKFAVQNALQAVGVPSAAVQLPSERIEHDPGTQEFGLWPEVVHEEMGRVRVDGLPVHLSETDWQMSRGAPLLGQHNDFVYGKMLGLPASEIDDLRAAQVI
jgi:crotonobetainyl-CoA:carnitine CoA-transferase CaiB-like acyl-CoA transferase